MTDDAKRDSEAARKLELEQLAATEESKRKALETRERIDAQLRGFLGTVEPEDQNTGVRRLDELMSRAAAEAATLPQVSDSDDPGPTTLRSEELDRLARDERIVVVEDYDDIRAQIAEDLREMGYRVREAADGVEAIEKIFRDSVLPDLVIVDLGLPYLDGLGVIAAMRSQARTRDLPYLVISAGANIKKLLAENPGMAAEHVFAKPYDYALMRDAVKRRIEEWRNMPKAPW